MTLDARIDAFVRRQVAAGREFAPIASAPWLAPLEAALPARLPPSFRSLVRRYRFGPFEVAGVAFFGNRGEGEPDDLAIAALRDPVLARVLSRHGFVQVGRPNTGAYDPVCFDVGRRSKRGEAPLVCLDHEEILVLERIRVLREVAASFEDAIGG